MKLMNVVFDEYYDDVDIILVPDDMAEVIDDLLGIYNDWTSEQKKRGVWHKFRDGITGFVAATDTVDFIEWVNHFYYDEEGEITIIESNTKYNPLYPQIDF